MHKIRIFSKPDKTFEREILTFARDFNRFISSKMLLFIVCELNVGKHTRYLFFRDTLLFL